MALVGSSLLTVKVKSSGPRDSANDHRSSLWADLLCQIPLLCQPPPPHQLDIVRHVTRSQLILFIAGHSGNLFIACISRQNTQRKYTDLAMSRALRIQNVLLVLATVTATAVCPHRCTWCVMRSDIQCSLGINVGCLVSYETKALSTRPPTWTMPSESLYGLNFFNSPFLRQSLRFIWLYLIQWCSASCNSLGNKGPSLGFMSFSSGCVLL